MSKTAAAADSTGVPVGAGQPLKAVMVLADVAALLGVTTGWAYKLELGGHLKPFELPMLGRRKRYSGRRFQAWLDSEPEQRIGLVAASRRAYTR